MPAKNREAGSSPATPRRTARAAKAAPPRKGKTAPPRSTRKAEPAREAAVTLDRRRRDRRAADDVAAVVESPAPQLERRKKIQRRRQIDPTTCERDYTIEEVEFMNAMDDYKRTSGRMFPTCSEVLEVIRGLGYVKVSPLEFARLAGEQAPADFTASASDADSPTA